MLNYCVSLVRYKLTMKLYIKYMVSQRCKMLVVQELTKLDLHVIVVDLGVVEILEEISKEDWEKLRSSVRKQVVEKINRLLKTNIESLIEEEDYLDPPRISERTNSFAGALYGASSNDRIG